MDFGALRLPVAEIPRWIRHSFFCRAEGEMVECVSMTMGF